MTQNDKAVFFHTLHSQENPLVLYNVWDAATAKAVFDQGAKAVATGSWSIAAAHGFLDGQNIPLSFVIKIIERIVQTVDIPVTVDFECGYSNDLGVLSDNFKQIIDTGAIGINFEDQIIGKNKLQSTADQARRIEVLADTAEKSNVEMFLNARTDVFLQEQNVDCHSNLMADALVREKEYNDAGATGFFVPGLSDAGLIKQLCNEASLPVNIMASAVTMDINEMEDLGVARISFGPHPFIDHIETFKSRAAEAVR